MVRAKVVVRLKQERNKVIMKGKNNKKLTQVGNVHGYQRTIKENLRNTQNVGTEQLSDKTAIKKASEIF